MEWLNYHHLQYFWVTARSGSIAKASRELLLSPPTISTQISKLESNLGERGSKPIVISSVNPA